MADFAPACLGEGTYDALVRTRRTKLGGPRTIGELTLRYGNWSRALNATSTAGVSVPMTGRDGANCRDVLNQITDPWRFELELWRSSEQVWCGPIRDVSSDPGADTGQILASDVSHWMNVRLFLHAMKPRGIDLAEIFAGYVLYATQGILPPWGVANANPLPNDDPGIIVQPTPTGIVGDRTVAVSDLKYVMGELAELATTGCDWSVTNRTWWIGGKVILDGEGGKPLTLPGWLVDEHFRTPGRLRLTGEGQVTDAWVRGNAHRGHVGGPDPVDGVLIQRVQDAYSIEDQGSADAAALTWHDRAAEPLTYLEGNNALDPSAPVDVQTLIAGTLLKVDLGSAGAVQYRGPLRLERVEANFNAEGEEITVALQPEGTSFDARGEG